MRVDDAAAVTDEEVVERVLGGEIDAYEILMRRYNRRLFRIARSIVEDDDEAEDVMQDAYVRAYANLRQYAGRAKFSSWLTRIAIHEALARARRRGRVVELGMREEEEGAADPMDTLPSREPGPHERAVGKEMRSLLEKAVSALPPIYRSVFVMREVEGLNVSETAACLGIREETVKVRLHRARAMLREDLLVQDGPVISAIFPFHLSRCDRVVDAVLRRIRSGDLPPAGIFPS